MSADVRVKRVVEKKAAYRFPRNAAYHEAGHAVARIMVGAPATNIRIFADGGGFVEGDIESWISTNPGLGVAWDLLIALMAGVYAESRACRRPVKRLLMTHGIKDYAFALGVVIVIAKRSKISEAAVWKQTNLERALCLRNGWRTIELVAEKLQERGCVSARVLKAMTKNHRRVLVTSLERPDCR